MKYFLEIAAVHKFGLNPRKYLSSNFIETRITKWAWFLSILFFASIGNARDFDGAAGQALDRVAASSGWRKLLFYQKSMLQPESSAIDSADFFFAQDGRINPRAELQASLREFMRPVELFKSNINQHPRCRFPARWSWLKERLSLFEVEEIECPALKAWLARMSGDRVSLVFSTYFAGNPASLFGHTLLRIHRRTSGAQGGYGSPLLDSVINFGAVPDSDNALKYVLYGVTGGFPGKFGVDRYYTKIQEYSNFENRDLWEYELKFDARQVEWLMLLTWELGPHHFDYYYFDENCSYILLMLLDCLDESLTLSSQFRVYTIPAETVRAVNSVPGLVVSKTYRPSMHTRFIQRYAELSLEHKYVFWLALDSSSASKLASELGSLDVAQAARIIDAALDYIAFKEKISGDRQPDIYKTQYKTLIDLRSQRTYKNLTPIVPPHESPDISHPASMVSIGHRSLVRPSSEAIDRNVMQLRWQPALHTVDDLNQGYGIGQNIKFFNTEADIHGIDPTILLTRFDLIDIRATPPWQSSSFPLSWMLQLSYERYKYSDIKEDEIHPGAHARVGLGFSLHHHPLDLLLSVMPLIEIGAMSESGYNSYAKFGALTAIACEWQKVKVVSETLILKSARSSITEINHRLAGFYFPDGNWALGLQSDLSLKQGSVSFLAKHYY
jgi:hypothetical protein